MIKRKRLYIILGGMILLIAGGAFAASRGASAPVMTTDVVKRMDLLQTVEVTGAVESESDVELSFGTSGVVSAVNVRVGDTVRSGQVLATLNAGSLHAAYAQALQALIEAQANVAKAEAGASLEEAGVSDADVAVAEAALAAAELGVERVKVETAADSAQAKEDVVEVLRALVAEVRQALAQADTVLGVENTLFNRDFDDVLGVEDFASLSAAESSFELAAKSRDAAEAALIAVTGTDATSAADLAEIAYEDTYNTLTYTSRVLDATSADSVSLSLDDLVVYKATIASAQASLISAGSALRSARQTSSDADRAMALDVADAEAVVTSREADVARAEASLQNVTTAPREVDVAPYKASVGQAEANVDAALARLRDAQIVAPISGTVTVVEIDRGESASALTPVITVLSSGDTYAITLNLPEADVAKVTAGENAVISFDAFGDDQLFYGVVASINPAQTVIQDVVFYEAKVFLNLDQDLSLVKPGMSATVTITTDAREDVLVVPSRAVLEKNSVKYVRVPEGETYVERTVQVGLRADGGLIEVTSGVSEGETIIVSLKAK